MSLHSTNILFKLAETNPHYLLKDFPIKLGNVHCQTEKDIKCKTAYIHLNKSLIKQMHLR